MVHNAFIFLVGFATGSLVPALGLPDATALSSLYEASGRTLAPGQTVTPHILLDSTLHGKSAGIFHQRCDGVPNTYTIVYLKDLETGRPLAVLGGFARMAWSSHESLQKDPSAFLFAFDTPSFPSSPEPPSIIVSRYSVPDKPVYIDTNSQLQSLLDTLDVATAYNLIHSPKTGFNFGAHVLYFQNDLSSPDTLVIPSDLNLIRPSSDPFLTPPHYLYGREVVSYLAALGLTPKRRIYPSKVYDKSVDVRDEFLSPLSVTYSWEYQVLTLEPVSAVPVLTGSGSASVQEGSAAKSAEQVPTPVQETGSESKSAGVWAWGWAHILRDEKGRDAAERQRLAKEAAARAVGLGSGPADENDDPGPESLPFSVKLTAHKRRTEEGLRALKDFFKGEWGLTARKA